MFRHIRSYGLLASLLLFLCIGCGGTEKPASSETNKSTADAGTTPGAEALPDTQPGAVSTNGNSGDTAGKSTQPNANGDAFASNSSTPAVKPETPSVSSTESKSLATNAAVVPATADAAVMAALGGLAGDRPQTLWEFLPASYQKDVNDVIHLTAEKSDKDVWNQTFATLKKGSEVLKSQKQHFLTALTKNNPESKPEDLAEAWDQVVALVTTLVTSDLSDLEKVRKLNLGAFLGETGGKMVKQIKVLVTLAPVPVDPFDIIAQTKAELVSAEGDTATVRLSAPGEEPQEEEFVKVEGKWIPKSLADGWKENIEKTKAALEAGSANNEQMKPQILAVLGEMNTALDRLSVAESQEQFEASGQQLIGMLFGTMMMFAPPGAGPGLGPGLPPGNNPDDAKNPGNGEKKPGGEKKPEGGDKPKAEPKTTEKSPADKRSDGDK